MSTVSASSYACATCGKHFVAKMSLRGHYARCVSRKNVPRHGNESSAKMTGSSAVAVVAPRLFECEICGKTFLAASSLKGHRSRCIWITKNGSFTRRGYLSSTSSAKMQAERPQVTPAPCKDESDSNDDINSITDVTNELAAAAWRSHAGIAFQ